MSASAWPVACAQRTGPVIISKEGTPRPAWSRSGTGAWSTGSWSTEWLANHGPSPRGARRLRRSYQLGRPAASPYPAGISGGRPSPVTGRAAAGRSSCPSAWISATTRARPGQRWAHHPEVERDPAHRPRTLLACPGPDRAARDAGVGTRGGAGGGCTLFFVVTRRAPDDDEWWSCATARPATPGEATSLRWHCREQLCAGPRPGTASARPGAGFRRPVSRAAVPCLMAVRLLEVLADACDEEIR